MPMWADPKTDAEAIGAAGAYRDHRQQQVETARFSNDRERFAVLPHAGVLSCFVWRKDRADAVDLTRRRENPRAAYEEAMTDAT
ncbi:hypothetical protein [Phenylobacterium sp.]|uniref:hypothetical protein n=1 Tax=Phenylobacterium sp. TaxID=1871053 RepID=UPI002FCB4862